jgi:group I intron endonuclease
MYDCDKEDYFRDIYDIPDTEFHTLQNSHTEEEYSVFNHEAGIIDILWIKYIIDNNYPKFTVYMHVNKINGKRYIGITKINPYKRWGTYGVGYKTQRYFYKSIQKYGWDNFEHIIVATNLSKDDAKTMETNLIIKYKTLNRYYGYNAMYQDNYRSDVSDETRKKMSEKRKKMIRETPGYIPRHKKMINEYWSYSENRLSARKRKLLEYQLHPERRPIKEKHPLYGKHLSLSHREKIRNGNKGKVRSEEFKRKLSLAKKGVKMSEEAKLNMRGPRPSITGSKHHMFGKHLSDYSKHKISLKNKGKSSWNKGKRGIYTAEALERIGAAHRGTHHTEEVKERIRNSTMGEKNHFYGKTHSNTSKNKISEANKGRICYNNGIQNRYFKPEEEIPQGYIKGKINK